MATLRRRPLQGVRTVVRFNWHFFALAGVFVIGAFLLAGAMDPWLSGFFMMIGILAACAVTVSLLATIWAYDLSPLYRFAWLDPVLKQAGRMANIHAGFDESSAGIRARFPRVSLRVFDFYDPAKHTEISIRRARRASPPVPGTISIPATQIPAGDGEFDVVLLMLAAHEIRDAAERVAFLREVRRVLQSAGKVVLVEHFRDRANVLAYHLGAWHFHTRSQWLEAVRQAGLCVIKERRLNCFVTCLILRKNGH